MNILHPKALEGLELFKLHVFLAKQCPSFSSIRAMYCVERACGDYEYRIGKEPGCIDPSFTTQEQEPHVLLVCSNCDHELQHCWSVLC